MIRALGYVGDAPHWLAFADEVTRAQLAIQGFQVHRHGARMESTRALHDGARQRVVAMTRQDVGGVRLPVFAEKRDETPLGVHILRQWQLSGGHGALPS